MSTRKYSLNEAFFSQWSPEMAYVLGFWFADGYMRHEKSYRVVFTSTDFSLLLQIRKVMASSHPIHKRFSRKGKVPEYDLIVFSKSLYSKLQGLGGTRRKTKKAIFPVIPSDYFPDFIRGYFDGDGSVFYTNYVSTKNGKLRTELRSNFTAGNPRFLEKLQGFLINKLGVSRKKVCPFNNGGSWKLGYGTADTVKLLRFMYYPDCPVALERKASFAESVLTGKLLICRGVGIRFARVS